MKRERERERERTERETEREKRHTHHTKTMKSEEEKRDKIFFPKSDDGSSHSQTFFRKNTHAHLT